MDNELHLLGMAKKAGRLEIGEEPVAAAARARKARLILAAGDAADNTLRRAAHFGEIGNTKVLRVPYSKGELGWAVGRTSCAMLAFTDAGFASALAEKLAARDPETYAADAEELKTKADKMLQRQKEKRQHEKNLERGKKHPWAAPPKEERKKPSRGGRSAGGPAAGKKS